MSLSIELSGNKSDQKIWYLSVNVMNKTLFAVVALGAMIGLQGCGGSGNSNTLPDPEVMFINGIPDTTNIDFTLNDVAEASNIPFMGTGGAFKSVEYILPDDGGYDIGIRRNGTTTYLDLFGTGFNRDTDNLLVAVGLQNPGSEPLKRPLILSFTVDRKAPTGTRSRIVFLNGLIRATGFDTPNVTFQSVIPGDPSSIDNPQFVTRDVPYSETRVLTVDAGARRFIVRRADTDALVQYASTDFTFVAGKIYLALISGQESNPTLALQPTMQFIEIETQE